VLELAALPRADRPLCCFCTESGLGGTQKQRALVEAEKQFDVFITGDLNLNFQQDVTKHNIAVVVLHAESTQLHHTLPLMPKVLVLLPTLKPGQVFDVYP